MCRSVWVTELFVNLPIPNPGAQAHLSTLEVLRVRERALIPSFDVFIFGLVVESIKELGGASYSVHNDDTWWWQNDIYPFLTKKSICDLCIVEISEL